MDGAGAPKFSLLGDYYGPVSAGLWRTPGGGDERDPVVAAMDVPWTALWVDLGMLLSHSSTKNNQLRTGADKGNPTV